MFREVVEDNREEKEIMGEVHLPKPSWAGRYQAPGGGESIVDETGNAFYPGGWGVGRMGSCGKIT